MSVNAKCNRAVKSREISPENLLLSLTVGTKHSHCPVVLGRYFVFLLISVEDQWSFMTSLTGSEVRDNCVDINFYPAPINVGFFHIWHSQILRPPIYFCSH